MYSKKKILFTIPTLNGGGAERVFTTYIRTLDSKMWDINLLLVKRTGVFLDMIPDNVKIVSLDKKRTRYSLFTLIKYIKQIDPDLIVSTSNYFNILLLIASYFISSKRMICLYEQSMPSAQFDNKYLPRYYLWLMRLLYKKADYIIAQTEEMKTEITNYYNNPKKEIIVSVNPIDEDYIQNQLKDADNPYDTDKINIVVSGRIREEKGQDYLIRSFQNVIRENPSFKLNVLGGIGNKDFYDKLIKLIDEFKIEKNIEFLGFKSDPYPYYKFADLLVLPSRWEGLPNVVLEAMYLQTPVIVTNCIPFFKRLINERENGFIVEYGDTKALANAILNSNTLSVKKRTIPKVDMNGIFKSMI